MKLFKTQYLLCLLMVLFSVACGSNDDEGGGNSPLTPAEHKAKLEEAGVSFLKEFKAADFESALTAIQTFEELMNVDRNRAALMMLKPVQAIVSNNDMNAMAKLAASANVNKLSDYFGIFTYNQTSGRWDEEESTEKLEYRYVADSKNVVITITCAASGSVVEDIEIPTVADLKMIISGKEELALKVNTTLTDNNKTGNATVKLTVATNYVWDATLNAKSSEVALNYNLSKSGKSLISSNVKVNGKGLTDPDNLDTENPENFLSAGELQFSVMDIAVKGNVNIQTLIKELDAMGKLQDEQESAEEARIINKNAKIVLIYKGEDSKIGDIIMAVYSDEYHGSDGVIRYYDIEPRLVFASDNSEVSLEEYFEDEAGFKKLIDTAKTLFEDFGSILNK